MPLHGIARLMAGRWTVRLIGVLGLMLTARLLTPSDFGLMTQSMLLLGLVSMLTEFQMGKVLSTTAHPTPAHLNSVFTIHFLMGLGAYGVAVALAYPLTLLLNEPRLLAIVLLCGLEWPLQGLCSPKLQLLIMHNRHRDYALFQIGVKICQVLAAVIFAFWFGNYYALVAGILVMSCAYVVLSYVVAPHRSRFCLQQGRWAWRHGCAYGSGGMSYALTNYLLTAPSALLKSSHEAGAYSVATRTANMAISEALYPTAVALFPYLRQQQHQNGTLPARTLRQLMLITAGLAIFMGGMGVLLSPCWLWIVGQQWREALPLLQVCIVAQSMHGLSTIWGSILQSLNHAAIHARLQWTTVSVLFIGLGVAYPYNNVNDLLYIALCSGVFNVVGHGWALQRLYTAKSA